MKKILRLKSSKKKPKDQRKIKTENEQLPKLAIETQTPENSKISSKDIKHLMNLMNLIDEYASKGKYETAIASCRQVLDGIQNEQLNCFPRAVIMKKLNELENNVLEIKVSTEFISNEKKQIELKNDKTIAFVKLSLQFIQKIKEADGMKHGFEFLQSLCRNEFDLHNQLSDELNEARILDLESYLNVIQSKYKEAIELSDTAIKIRGLARFDNEEMLISFSCKSYAYFSMKEYSKAIHFVEETLKIAESNQAIHSHFVAFTLNNLALVYLKSRTKSEEIEKLYMRALEIAKSIDLSKFNKPKSEIIRILIEKIEFARTFLPFQTEFGDGLVFCGSCGYKCTKKTYKNHCASCGSISKPTELLLSEMHMIKCLCGSLITYVDDAKTVNCSVVNCNASIEIPENHLDFYLTQLDDFY